MWTEYYRIEHIIRKRVHSRNICYSTQTKFGYQIAEYYTFLTEVGNVTLKSNGDVVLCDEFLYKSNGDEALNYDSL